MFETLHSERKYQGKVFSIRRDQISLPNGDTTNLDILEHSGSVVILPIDSDGFVWCVRQYRHATEANILELPAGNLEPDEDPQECAQRELQEEIGMAADDLQKNWRVLPCARLFH